MKMLQWVAAWGPSINNLHTLQYAMYAHRLFLLAGMSHIISRFCWWIFFFFEKKSFWQIYAHVLPYFKVWAKIFFLDLSHDSLRYDIILWLQKGQISLKRALFDLNESWLIEIYHYITAKEPYNHSKESC